MTQSIVQFIALCRSQIGVHEAPPGSNDQKYGVQFGWDGVSWCAEFGWCMYADAGVVLPIKTASVVEEYQFAESHGLAIPSTSAVPGDSICRTWTGKQIGQAGFDAEQTHFQILLGKSGSALDLIGGNQADPSGGIVSYDTATAGEDTILGAIAYSRLFTQPAPAAPVRSTTPPSPKSPSHPNPKPMLYQGVPLTAQTEAWTKQVQLRVHATTDGVYGPKTTAAVEAFQHAHGLTVDGVVGPMTYAALGL